MWNSPSRKPTTTRGSTACSRQGSRSRTARCASPTARAGASRSTPIGSPKRLIARARSADAARLGLLLTRADAAAPPLEAPLRMLFEPLRRNVLSLDQTTHCGRDINRRPLFMTHLRRAGQTNDKDQRNNRSWVPFSQAASRRLSRHIPGHIGASRVYSTSTVPPAVWMRALRRKRILEAHHATDSRD